MAQKFAVQKLRRYDGKEAVGYDYGQVTIRIPISMDEVMSAGEVIQMSYRQLRNVRKCRRLRSLFMA